MHATLHDALAAAGIALRRWTPGTQRLPCPACNKPGDRDALAVTLGGGGAQWFCHRLCSLKGGWTPREHLRRQKEIFGKSLPENRPKGRPTGFASETGAATGMSPRETLAPESRKFWSGSLPITTDSPPGRYLRGRLCALPPNDVRWHPAAWHRFERREMPAMVALITDIVTREAISLHFTFLKPDGSGKADIERPRLYLAGHKKCGVVRLHRDEAVEQGIILGEGIETCLSYALEFAPIWATLDAGNLGNFPVLPGIEGVTVLVDHDKAGEGAFAKLRDRYYAAGFRHRLDIIRVQAATAGHDINDIARTA